jgi:hypothetical protein
MTGVLDKVEFRCGTCRVRFECAPGRVEDNPDAPWHPYAYFADCSRCGRECSEVYWDRNLRKAHAMATGPKTPEGKAKVAGNLPAERTKELTDRTRFNALKHGAYARTAKFWPARPGKYPHCQSCEHFNQGCDELPAPDHTNPPGCLKRTELMMSHLIAYESGDPKQLMASQAELQASLRALIDDMILAIVQDGVVQRKYDYSIDKDGNVDFISTLNAEGQLEKSITLVAHPLLKTLIEFMHRNGMTLTDSAMTAKTHDDQALMQGYLDSAADDRESEASYREQQRRTLDDLRTMIDNANKNRARDPVLLEHEESHGH